MFPDFSCAQAYCGGNGGDGGDGGDGGRKGLHAGRKRNPLCPLQLKKKYNDLGVQSTHSRNRHRQDLNLRGQSPSPAPAGTRLQHSTKHSAAAA